MGFSFLLPIFVTFVGGYFLFRLRFFFILHPIRTAKRLALALKERKSRRSLSLALAGTLGVGNIFGVAVGIIIGGEGVLFWLLVSAVFASVIKYAEALCVADLGESGGMAALIRRRYPLFAGFASRLYSVLCLLVALVMGSAVQSGSVLSLAERAVGAPSGVAASFFAVLVLIVTLGGRRKITDATESIIPLTTVIYILLSFAVIFVNFEALPGAVSKIFSSAFSPSAAVGGGFIFLSTRALSEGYARGILSNEAGAGTSSMAHASCGADPVTAGLFGVCEVFFDTPLLCTLTGLVIVSSVDSPSSYSSAMALVFDAFSFSLGSYAALAVFVCVFLFAYSTVICWYYYGEESLVYLTGRKMKWLYTPIFTAFIFVGAFSDSFFIVSLCDVILLLMTALTLIALLLSSRRIVSLSGDGGVIKPKK